MATNDMGPGPLKKARRLVQKTTKKITKGTFLEDSKKYPGEKNNPFAQKGGTTKKYQKGGKTTSFTDDIATGLDNVFRKTYPFNIPHTQTTKALKAVDDYLTKGKGKMSDPYEALKAKVKKTMKVPNKKQAGGPTDPVTAMYKAKGEKVPTTKETVKYVKKRGSGYIAPTKPKAPAGWSTREEATPSTRRYQNGGTGMTPPMPSPKPKPKTYPRGLAPTPKPQINAKGNPGNEGYNRYTGPRSPSMNAADYKAKVIERYGSEETARDAKAIQKKGGATKKMKIGGMVNPNAKLQAAKSAGSKGVMSGVNPKAAASKVVRGRVGGTSVAPKKATPGRK
jgi:hypothetical protein